MRFCDFVKCNSCNEGKYEVKSGQYGYYAGCTSYPQCESTLKIPDLIYQFLLTNGLNIYGWKEKCWKCNMDTKVYTYFLAYDLGCNYYYYFKDIFSNIEKLNLGTIPSLDLIMEKRYPNIKNYYFQKKEKNEISNICEKCGIVIGNSYIEHNIHKKDHTLYNDLFQYNMEQHLDCIIPLKEDDVFKKELIQALKNACFLIKI